MTIKLRAIKTKPHKYSNMQETAIKSCKYETKVK